MSEARVTVGILAPSTEVREILRSQLEATKQATVELEVEQYCSASGDRTTRRFMDVRPEVIIVDMDDPEAAVRALKILHTAIPECWLLVTSGINEPEQIIESMRAGAREFLRAPITLPSLSDALGRYVAEKKGRERTKDSGTIYCVTSAKGGSGATSITINLASSIAELPDTRVAIIDLNSPMGDAAAYLNLRPKFTVSDALGASSRLDRTLIQSFMCKASNLAVMPGPKEFWPEQAPGTSTVPGTSELARLLEVVTETYSHTLIDVAASLDKKQLEMVIDKSTGVVVVLTPELPALWRTQRLLSFLRDCGATDKLQLVINRSRTSDPITQEQIETTLRKSVYWTLPNNYNACIEAINSGNPLVTNNHSDLAKSYRDLSRHLTGTAPPIKRRGFLGLFGSRN